MQPQVQTNVELNCERQCEWEWGRQWECDYQEREMEDIQEKSVNTMISPENTNNYLQINCKCMSNGWALSMQQKERHKKKLKQNTGITAHSTVFTASMQWKAIKNVEIFK